MTLADPTQVELRQAATVMLVRDGVDGLEVFMLGRNPHSEFAGGAFVFPGGAVDQHDLHADLEPHCAGLTDATASTLLGIDQGGLAFWVAAIRECFEECGLLLAYDQQGDIVRLDDSRVEARFRQHRQRVDAGMLSLIDLCADEQLTLACDTMHYMSHWVTPVGPSRRYDTRFFVARAPDAQVGLHDNRETVANLWVQPRAALERGRSGELAIMSPTASNLEALSRFESADQVLAAASSFTEFPPVRSRIVEEDGGSRILLPGDPGYEGAIP